MDFSRALRRLNILCRAGVSITEQTLKREPHDGAAVGSKHALAESFKPISSAKVADKHLVPFLTVKQEEIQTLILYFPRVGEL